MEAFSTVIDFVYTDAAPALSGENVQDVLAAATRWQLPRLVELCESFFFAGIDDDNVLDVLQVSCAWRT